MFTGHASASITKPLVRLLIHTRTLYLFTASDFPTFALPTTLFGLCAALSGPLLTTNTTPSLLACLSRIPLALTLIWLNLLAFNISNQRTLTAVEEDKINKPHRPIPCGRVSCDEAKQLLLVLTPVVGVAGYASGVWSETSLLFAAQWMYNDLGGCDGPYLVRNLLIAVGYGLYSSIALRVMVGVGHEVNAKGVWWVLMVMLVMFVTQHVCDIKDAEGDRFRGRKSAPIVLGDEMCRWSVAVPVMVCSVVCPLFFGLGMGSLAVTMGLGVLVAFRTLVYRDLKADQLTWKLWALWTCSLFVLPLVAESAVFGRTWQGAVDALCSNVDCSGGLNVAAVSAVAMIVEGRRILVGAGEENATMQTPTITVEGVVA